MPRRRRGHEWETQRELRALIPDDKLLIPGVLDTATNFIEHPRLEAQRIVDIMDAKLAAMAEDAAPAG